MKTPLLSVIIPAYNVEDYIEECLNSVFQQLTDDVEVIIVDDGSNDRTSELIRQYKKSGVVVVSQKNSGIAAARNSGLDIVTGEYVAFLDSDDFWVPNFLKVLLPNIKCTERADIVTYSYYEFFSSEKCFAKKTLQLSGNYNLPNDSCMKSIAQSGNWYLWSFIAKRELYKNIRFDEGRRFEDLLISPLIYANSKSISIIDDCLVYYRQRDNSITRRLTPADIDDGWYAMDRWLDYYKKGKKNKCFWRILILNTFISCVSRCARVSNADGKVVQANIRKYSSLLPDKVIFDLPNIKCWAYFFFPQLMYKRLKKVVQKDY